MLERKYWREEAAYLPLVDPEEGKKNPWLRRPMVQSRKKFLPDPPEGRSDKGPWINFSSAPGGLPVLKVPKVKEGELVRWVVRWLRLRRFEVDWPPVNL